VLHLQRQLHLQQHLGELAEQLSVWDAVAEHASALASQTPWPPGLAVYF